MNRALEVLATGPLALVEDLGRPGLAHLGVAASGAADRGAHRLGARLLGNAESDASIEVTAGGLVVRARADLLVCLTGAAAPAHVDGRPVGHAATVRLGSGAVLRLGAPPHGLRTHLSVRGGIDVRPVLGSRSSDTLTGIGPPVLRAGDVLPVGPPRGDLPATDHAPTLGPGAGELVLTMDPGPRQDWLEDLDAVTGHRAVSSRSNRVGVRLEGPPVRWRAARRGTELPSEGLVAGAVQVPPGGEPVVFLRDHPVTGGYPVVGVLRASDLDTLAQGVPGQGVRLRWS